MGNTPPNTLLEPFRVLDLSDESGVLCGRILADLGADVIKIEPPGGDAMRQIGPFYHDIPDPEKSLYWFTFNTSKRSITLDITKPEGQSIFKKLAQTADFVIECFYPGFMEKMGMGYDDLNRTNSRIVMTSITPYGQSGPYAEYKSSDITALAMGGLMYLMGDPDRPPVRVSAQQAYAQAGAQAAAGTMVAHYHRETSGEGQHVDVSMQEAVSNTLDTTQQGWDLQKLIFKRTGCSRALGDRVVRAVYPCKDGYMACWSPNDLNVFVQWLKDAGFAEDAAELAGLIDIWEQIEGGTLSLSQALTQEELDRFQELRMPFLKAHTKAELYKKAFEHHFGWVPVQTPMDLVEYAQLKTRGYFVDVDHPELGCSITYPGAPYKLSRTPWRIKNRAPLMGEHNQEIYREELGFTKNDMQAMKKAAII
ncbi:MAG: CoA transferase [Desulfobacterales bacterium]